MTDSLRTLVDGIAGQWAVPGGAVLIVGRSGEVFSHQFGFADVAGANLVAPHHLFQVGSISKVFTSIVVLHLRRRGLVDLDQSVGSVLDWLPEPLRADGITIRRLLNHTAGLVASVDALPDEIGQVASFTGEVSPASPGSFFHYSNLGFILLGLVVRRVSGRRLVDLVRDDVFAPLGMTSSIACVTHDDYRSLARGCQPLHDDRPWAPGAALVGAPWLEVAGADGNVAATASDLGRFARMLLGRGELEGSSVLDAADFATMWTSTAPDGEDVLALPGVTPADTSHYGLGVNVERSCGRTVLSHGGGMVGYASFLLADLDDGVAVCVLTNANGDSPVAEAIARCVAAEYRSPGAVDPEALDPRWWDAGVLEHPADTVVFTSAATSITVRVEDRDGERVAMSVECDGTRSPLWRNWSGRGVTTHPSLRRFALDYEAGVWRWGPREFTRAGDPVPLPAPVDDWEPLCGHYRSYTPWFTNFRVVLRRGRPFLVAAGGVEAPSEDMELVHLEGSSFRIGADPRLPERLTFGPRVGAMVPWVDRDGCRYSRSFTD
ncbi:beta-lactamase family protein [Mycobacterium yunnanensis]|uniref:Beta-lactamase family protein n=1 Tax=Mycobacterium yunnanensis TaxID=368477 RepID=A0A9X3C1B8_9MYCO|nr:serine hydrolase domain-containing protein [Mycobacterium yunnanensis]MCV7420156.1 beta-lactamase family protein [Mycobacterium yunnanensis]